MLTAQPHTVEDGVTVPPTPVELHTGGDASVPTVDTFERGPEGFFEPPDTGG